MIKFLIDENVGHSLIKYLQDQEYDVKSVSELFPSRDDIFIMDRANQEDRIIVTNDKDFGYLVFRSKIPVLAVILLRFRDKTPR